ncbi:probable transcription factor Pur-alpha 1 at C-terminar half [Coccomyxa sp. Obi]|nr:probable transcription factor Pur-alpha 1 at C-terminar half [Coccomyxa sp. Obi]
MVNVEQLLTANKGSTLADAALLSSNLTQSLKGLSMGGSFGTHDKALQQPLPLPPPPPLHVGHETMALQQPLALLPPPPPLHVGHETMVGPGPAPPMLTSTEEDSLLVRTDHKRYFFDACSKHHGEFLRITEVFGQDRVSIVVAANAMGLFHQALGTCVRCLIKTSGTLRI